MAFKPLWLLGLALALSGPAAADAPAPLVLALRAQVQLDHARIVLGDVAELPADAAPGLAQLELGPAPRIEAFERFTREQLALLIRRRFHQALPALAWSGADSVTVHSMTQPVSGTVLGQAAVDAVVAAFAARHPGMTAAPQAMPPDVEIALGDYTIQARPLEAPRLPARVAVWLDLVAGGQVARSVVVPVSITLRRDAYVARRRLAAGSVVQPDDFEVREENVAGLHARPVAASDRDARWRLRRAVQAGQVLAQDVLPAPGTVFPGDRIRLLTRSGAIGIEVDAVVQAEATPGQLVAVRAGNSSDTVAGRLTAAGTVVIE